MNNLTIRAHDNKWHCIYADNKHIACVEGKDVAEFIVKAINHRHSNIIKRLIFAIEKLEGKNERDTLTYQIIKEALDVIKPEGL